MTRIESSPTTVVRLGCAREHVHAMVAALNSSLLGVRSNRWGAPGECGIPADLVPRSLCVFSCLGSSLLVKLSRILSHCSPRSGLGMIRWKPALSWIDRKLFARFVPRRGASLSIHVIFKSIVNWFSFMLLLKTQRSRGLAVKPVDRRVPAISSYHSLVDSIQPYSALFKRTRMLPLCVR